MFYDHHLIGMHWLWWVISIIIILLIAFNIIPFRPKNDLKEDAMDILKIRFAKGEIEREEFEERKKILKQSK
ncbi:SHOCT domain-containing protein [Rhodohalobacter sp. 614A]|uniref:SHOCT domain-containing protein n=1 Tax=Rhodohalobacter sp. 614A TaxID=2908649 RepID=UPI001F215DFA|nr:SHOCT domain-containing protein [Rhodohalobacter sp. 614A]